MFLDYHGKTGPIIIQDTIESPRADIIVRAAEEVGYESTDYNGASQEGTCVTLRLIIMSQGSDCVEHSAWAAKAYLTIDTLFAGFSKVQQNIKDGVRMSTSQAYLKPAMFRSNLHVATLAIVHRVCINPRSNWLMPLVDSVYNKPGIYKWSDKEIPYVTEMPLNGFQVIFEGIRATGVEFVWKGEIRQVFASREVILSAGAIDSPKILMLSGVGPKQHLQQLKVC